MCEEKKRLLHEYERLETALAQSVSALNKNAGLVGKVEYKRLRDFVEEQRLLAEKARIAFDAHVIEHKC